MFAGKTERLLAKASKYTFELFEVGLYRPLEDTRNDGKIFFDGYVCSRTGQREPAYNLNGAESIYWMQHDVIAIDEAWLVPLADLKQIFETASAMKKRVIVSFLNCLADGTTTASIDYLFSHCDEVLSCFANCSVCGDIASRTISLENSGEKIRIGDSGYQPACSRCWGEKVKA